MPKPLIMGVINITPDSFSDGGLYLARDAALRRAETLVEEGADLLDLGGESTRPGAREVGTQEELDRVLPVLEAITARLSIRLSIDTRKPAVAREAIARGATLINDVGGGRDPEMMELGKSPGVEFILMHMQGTPETMQISPSYPRGVVTEVAEYLRARVEAFAREGIASSRVWIDPGIGFGKTVAHNLELLRELDRFRGIGGRLAIGTSRKAFLGLGSGSPLEAPDARLPGTLASSLWAYGKGASVFRVHDVAPLRRAIETWEAINAGE